MLLNFRKNLAAGILLLGSVTAVYATQGAWSSGISFPALNRAHFFQFLINGKGYIGSGSYVTGSNLTFTKDVWEFDPLAGTWTQKADFGGNIRTGTLHFNVGDYGYAGCGADQFAVYNDFWKFDPAANQWTQAAYFPGPPRVYGQGFGMDTTGYCGMGRTFTAAGSTITYNDIYEYYPDSNTWAVKNSFPGSARSFASTFRIGATNYFLAGQSGNPVNQLWAYDASNDSWTQKSVFPGGSRIGMTALVIQDTAYAGLGRSQDPTSGITTYYNDFWMYDAPSDTWTQYTSLPAAPRFRTFGFGIDSLGYVGCGENVATSYTDAWVFNPRLTTTGVGIAENEISDIRFRYDAQQALALAEGLSFTGTWNVEVFTSTGQRVYSTRIRNTSQISVPMQEFGNGVYLISVNNGKEKKAFKFVR